MENKNKGLTLLDLFMILTTNLVALKIAGVTTLSWLGVFTPLIFFVGYIFILGLFLTLLGGNKEWENMKYLLWTIVNTMQYLV